MYRSRPAGNLDDNALLFLSSINDDADLFYYDLLGSQAHVVMLYEVGILSKDELVSILKGIDLLYTNVNLLKEYGDPSSEDIHELVESAIIKITGLDSGGKMHTARSRNDQVILDIRMKMRDDVNKQCENLLILLKSLLKVAENNIDSIMPLYTHMQHAQLGVFSHYLLSYGFSLLRDFERFSELYGRINYSPLGACAVGGSSMNINRERVSSLLGFSDILYNSIDATSSRDSLIEFASTALICMLNLSKIAEDLIIWSTSEFGFVSLSDTYSSTSSVMPQKKNPDPLELIRGKTGVMEGCFNSISSIMKGLPSGYSRDLQEIKPQLWKISSMLSDSLLIMNGVLSTLEIDKKKMYEASSKSYAVSLDIAEQMIKKYGIPFRLSHKLVGSLVDYAFKNGTAPLTSLNINDLSKILRSIDFYHPVLSAEGIYDIIQGMSPENSVKYRVTKGSPNREEQYKMIASIQSKIDKYKDDLHVRTRNLDDAIKSFTREIKEYIKG